MDIFRNGNLKMVQESGDKTPRILEILALEGNERSASRSGRFVHSG
jgi:hypothetical protein